MTHTRKWMKKHNITWWKAVIYTLIAYVLFALVTCSYLDKKTLYVTANARVETYNSTDNIYTESSWLAYEKSISKIKEYLDASYVPFDELQEAVYSVNSAYANLVIDESRTVNLPYDSVMRYPDDLRGKAVHVKGIVKNKTYTSLGSLLITISLDGNANKPVYLAFSESNDKANKLDVGNQLDVLGYCRGVYELGKTLPDGAAPYVTAYQVSNLSKPNTNK